jgi:hypothetical protein
MAIGFSGHHLSFGRTRWEEECRARFEETYKKDQSKDNPPNTPQLAPSKKKSLISPVMGKYGFYPEKRPGKGPKFVKTFTDKVFAITSLGYVDKLRQEKENREKKNQPKKRTAAKPASKIRAKKKTKTSTAASSEDEEQLGKIFN